MASVYVPISISDEAFSYTQSGGSFLRSCCGRHRACGIRLTRRSRKPLVIMLLLTVICLTVAPFLSFLMLPVSSRESSPLNELPRRTENLPPILEKIVTPEKYQNLDGHDESIVHDLDQNRPVSDLSASRGTSSRTYQTASEQSERQKAVVAAFQHAWSGYVQHAWGKDELRPLSKKSSTWFDLGLTIIDSIDTIWIMNLTAEYDQARAWIKDSFTANVNKDVNLFETTIRVLGGLLSIYTLSGEQVFLERAIDLGDRLLPAFKTSSHVPYSDVNLRSGKAHAPRWGPDSSTSEVSTIQIEFKELSRLSGNDIYKDVVTEISDHLHSLEKHQGLVPYFINANTGQFSRKGMLTLGARADSYYEYLLKQYLQTGKTELVFKQDFESALNGMNSLLFRKTRQKGFLFIGESSSTGSFSPKMDHLACYFSGSLALAAQNGFQPSNWYMELAANITETCYETYRIHATGLAPEISYFNVNGEPDKADIYVKKNDHHNLLRPETIESLMYMYRITGDTKYQDWGWEIFKSFEKYTKVSGGGYSSIGNVENVNNVEMGRMDKMESFFLGETLKYLFLLFDDTKSVLPLDQYIFNTEAHPLPIHPPQTL